MPREITQPALVFSFFAILALQASVGFLEAPVFGMRFAPIRAAIWFTDAAFTGSFGQLGGTVLLVVIGVLLTWQAYRQALQQAA